MDLIQFEAAIDTHMAAWTPTPAIQVVRDNEPSNTDGVMEFVRLTILDGDGFIDEAAGIYSVTGSTLLHVFILSFDIFVEINTGRQRINEIRKSIAEHWQVFNLGSKEVNLLAPSFQRVGEEPPRYHCVVQISGTREERLTKRN